MANKKVKKVKKKDATVNIDVSPDILMTVVDTMKASSDQIEAMHKDIVGLAGARTALIEEMFDLHTRLESLENIVKSLKQEIVKLGKE